MTVNIQRVNDVLEEYYKLFYKTEDMALKRGIKALTHTELHIIESVGQDTQLTMNELADKIGITMGTATVAISKLSDKGYIKVKTPPRVEQRLNNDKKQKLNRYRALTEQLYRLYELVEELQEKQHSKSHVQTMDYTKVKITCSRTNYDFTGTNLLAKIQDTENKISKLKIAIEKEREYLSSVIDQIEDIRIRYIFWWRYYMLEEWQKVARLVGLKSERYCMKLHNEYLEKLDI